MLQTLPCSHEPLFGLYRSLFISAQRMQPLVVSGPLPNHLFLLVSSVLAGAISPIATANLIRAFIPLGHCISAMLAFSGGLHGCCFHFLILGAANLCLRVLSEDRQLGLYKTSSCAAATHRIARTKPHWNNH